MDRLWRRQLSWLLLASLVPIRDAQDVIARADLHGAAGYQPSPALGPDGAFADCPCTKSPVLALQGRAERGSRCHAWNKEEAGVCSKSEVPAWCSASWCYVDRLNCKRSATQSDADPAVSYSYETCGSLGSHYVDWRSVPLSKRLGRPLYVWAAGFQVGKYGDQRLGMNLNLRATLSFAAIVLKKLGVDVRDPEHLQYRELSNYSRAQHPHSQYTACVYDIALGNVDLCIGPVWDTDERRAMNVSFTGTIYVEEMALLMPTSERQSESPRVRTILMKTFEPFSCGLWALIFFTIALSTLAMVIFEHWLTPTAAVASQPSRRTIGTTVTSWLHSFLAAEVTSMPTTSGGKVFSVGYGFFVLVCISCYTANMATILIGEDQSRSRIDSIQDALRFGRRVCYHAALPTGTVRTLYHGLDTRGTPVDGSKAGLRIWEEHGCEVCILSEMMMADEWADRKSCGWFFAKRPVMSVPNGFYSSNTLSHEVSWMASKLRLDGTWDRVLEEVRQPSLCDASFRGGDSQLNASHMIGAIVVLVLSFGGGLLVHSYELSSEVECCAVKSCSGSEDEGDDVDPLQKQFGDVEAKDAPLDERALSAEVLPGLERVQLQLQEAVRELEELRSSVGTPTSSLQPLLRYFTMGRRAGRGQAVPGSSG